MAGIADYIPTPVMNGLRTGYHLGANALNPKEFIGYGLSQTGKAAQNMMPKFTPVHQRSTPDQNFENGDVLGTGSVKQHRNAKTGQHASNILPGQTNAFGGSLDLTA